MPPRVSGTRKSARLAGLPPGTPSYAGALSSPHDVGAADGSRVWLPELVERYASFLPPNEVPLKLRLLCRAAAAQFRDRTTVRLSLPSPPAEFAARWGDVAQIKRLREEERKQLFELTAASGVVENLELLYAHKRRGDFVIHCDVVSAAARAGQLEVCRMWLERILSFRFNLEEDRRYHHKLVIDTAQSGNQQLCEWALANCPVKQHSRAHVWILGDAAAAAMRAQHMALGEWFMQQLPEGLRQSSAATPAALAPQPQQPQLPAAAGGQEGLNGAAAHGQGDVEPPGAGEQGDGEDDDLAFDFEAAFAVWQQRPLPLPRGADEPWDAAPALPRARLLPLRALLASAARAAPDLATFIHLHAMLLDTPRVTLHLDDRPGVLAGAAACRAGDWQARVEWLEARGYPRTSQACSEAVRVTPPEEGLARLRWLMGRGYPLVSELLPMPTVIHSAAMSNNVPALRLCLEQPNTRLQPTSATVVAMMTAQEGALEALQVLMGAYPELAGTEACYVFSAAVKTGRTHVLRWMADNIPHRYLDLEEALNAAAASGRREQVVELLVGLGVPLSSAVFTAAAENREEAMMEWLVQEMGCPLPQDGLVYVHAAARADLYTLATLQRLGCPFAPNTFTRAIRDDDQAWGICEYSLQWLLGVGCPVDWPVALQVAEEHRADDPTLVAWVRERHREWQQKRRVWVRGERLRPRRGGGS
ncbi:hypothetical protein HYH02_013760 [Chlamydomonas schloesseri]|uniref:Uncharacterized protein n=1 Tax=Chlamydomonas schloesseri TaxID=2026947 RepID=A0A835SV56_9CHLO|nr:hypothetical protein HYH02_013760 [Chlamydomonas schloesseri]|eukprot:KAG2430398.1 hypothetical protein HYH02_013760 [Chlamydomonas schloesseri]